MRLKILDKPDNPDKPKQGIFKTIMRFLFSHFGLAILLIAYCCFGAQMYHVFEHPLEIKRIQQEVDSRKELENQRIRMRELILKWKQEQANEFGAMEEETEKDLELPSYHRQNKNQILFYMEGMRYKDKVIKQAIRELLENYHWNLTKSLTKKKVWKGSVHAEATADQWTFASSLVFAVSGISLIGYGHIKPASELSKFFTIPYCLFGIPLLLIFLSNLGRSLAKIIRYLYARACCRFCFKSREESLRQRNMLDTSVDETKQQDTSNPNSMKAKLRTEVEGFKVGGEEASDVLQSEDEPVPVILTAGILFFVIFLGAIVYHFWEKWSLVSAVYCSYTTLTTIGFGDFVPGFTTLSTAEGKWKLVFASVYIVIGLAVVSMGIDLMMEEVIVSIRSVGISLGLIKFVDEDGDGIDDEEQERVGKMNNMQKAARGRFGGRR